MEKNGVMNTVVRDLQTLFSVRVMGALSNGQLLDRFVERREGGAFEEIVCRHGPMVWGVCRRTLQDLRAKGICRRNCVADHRPVGRSLCSGSDHLCLQHRREAVERL